MSITYSVLRIGDPSDCGPNGECGIVIVGQSGDAAHGETVYCSKRHRHGMACAREALDNKGSNGRSLRETIQSWFSDRKAQPRIDVDPIPDDRSIS